MHTHVSSTMSRYQLRYLTAMQFFLCQYGTGAIKLFLTNVSCKFLLIMNIPVHIHTDYISKVHVTHQICMDCY